MDFFLLYFCLFVPLHAISCPSGTKYLKLNDGTWDCLVCNDCPRGKVKVANCSVEHDTQCEPCGNHSYYDDKVSDCRPCSGCPPGEFIEKNCSQFMDSLCEPCPNTTFSSESNSSGCADCSVCSRGYDTECKSIQNAVCSHADEGGGSGLVGVVIAILVVLLALAIGLGIFFIYRRKRYCWSRHGRKRSAQNKTADGVPFKSWRSCCRRMSVDHKKESSVEHDQFIPNEKHSSQSNGSNKDQIRELKEAQMELENRFKNMRFKEQLEMLSPSVGVLVCTKPIHKTSKEKEHMYKETTQELSVVFVGTKYIMTAYFALIDTLGVIENEASNHTGYAYHDINVTFNRGNSSSYSQFKILDSRPLYKNEELDLAILEIRPYPEQASKMNASEDCLANNEQQNNKWPLPVCLHTSLPSIDISTKIHFIIHDKYKKKNTLQLDNHSLIGDRNQTPQGITASCLNKAEEYLIKNSSDLVKNLRDKNRNENMLKDCTNDLKENGISKVFWSRKSTTNPGAPGFIVDKGGKCCKLYCICTGEFPRFMEDLSDYHQNQLKYLSGVYTGTVISALYKDMQNVKPSLADELFFVRGAVETDV